MCGIAGFISSQPALAWPETLKKITDSLTHRGPDGSGYWFDATRGIALGHRRLAIVDLTEEGAQPMRSESGRYQISYNGEIYNFPALKSELQASGHHFRGHSDTEMLLAAIEQWGVKAAVQRAAGMFGFALWDEKLGLLHLVRDRIGIKPLYYALVPNGVVFGSELKALRAFPGFSRQIDRDALQVFMRQMYVPSPYTIYEKCFKLPPGSILTLPCDPAKLTHALAEFSPHVGSAKRVAPDAYWSAEHTYLEGERQPDGRDEREIIGDLEQLLTQVVGEHMLSDVPLGGFLSGGFDSSLVTALMQAGSAQPVRTFSIGFEEAKFDEAPHAKAVAAHLGTNHTEMYVTAKDALDVIPSIPFSFDEPFADPSQIPTYLLCKLTRRHVTVSLSGDGGDELFAGYQRYFDTPKLWNQLRRIPQPIRDSAAWAMRKLPEERWSQAFAMLHRGLPEFLRPRAIASTGHRIAEVLASREPDNIYRAHLYQWSDSLGVVLGAKGYETPLTRTPRLGQLNSLLKRMMETDVNSYLPDDILVKVDRASMAVSLEARVPLLDHRIVEFAARLPEATLVSQGHGKHPLREILYRYVPKSLMERPKMGFGVPLATWLRGPLSEWGRALTSPAKLRADGYLDADVVKNAWDTHASGAGNRHYALWNVLMFQAWLEHERQA
ncbi:MAG: asparagine synthase (glutamine-hydrolyzing) [Polyangiaceae bacterium]|nr:asparagine synthase (glutamine-hydrolyzing) [Polyangiaceae bacterium]